VCGAGCGAQAADFFWPLGGGVITIFFSATLIGGPFLFQLIDAS